MLRTPKELRTGHQTKRSTSVLAPAYPCAHGLDRRIVGKTAHFEGSDDQNETGGP